ncbi:MAG: hypothetical protein HYS13_15975 [Planctomycetia bacterium]|nr:hypothetical protein [Planctomycetia bacterium]
MFLSALACSALLALSADEAAAKSAYGFRAPEKILADGKAIDVEIGHAAPCYADIDGDGAKDLLVGQFGEGKLRVYKNHGTTAQPRFADFKFLQAGGKDAIVPSG